jgi:hypothetical protein
MMRRFPLAVAVGATCFGALLAGRPAAAQDKDWGMVKGRAVFGGNAIPAQKPLDVNKDQDHCLSKGPILDEEWVVSKDNKGVRWAFIWLEPEKGSPPLKVHSSLQQIKDKQVFIDQPCCKFEPHALGMREGQELVAKNSAPIAHNVHWIGFPTKNPGGNVIVPAGQSHTIQGLKADRFPVQVKCDIHGWMKANVRVFDHPYFAVTDADGKFEIKNAPAGTYRLMTWHDSGYGPGGREGVQVVIKGGADTDVGKVELKGP